jgi:hypothetical protein
MSNMQGGGAEVKQFGREGMMFRCGEHRERFSLASATCLSGSLNERFSDKNWTLAYCPSFSYGGTPNLREANLVVL